MADLAGIVLKFIFHDVRRVSVKNLAAMDEDIIRATNTLTSRGLYRTQILMARAYISDEDKVHNIYKVYLLAQSINTRIR
jgi:hypothetical protein